MAGGRLRVIGTASDFMHKDMSERPSLNVKNAKFNTIDPNTSRCVS